MQVRQVQETSLYTSSGNQYSEINKIFLRFQTEVRAQRVCETKFTSGNSFNWNRFRIKGNHEPQNDSKKMF